MILVSGAPGNVGTELVRLLVASGRPARVLLRRPESAQKLALPGVDTAIGDLADRASLERALAGVDRIFVNSAVGPALLDQKNLIDAAKHAGVRHLVKRIQVRPGPVSRSALPAAGARSAEARRPLGEITR